jgi:phosphate-selective porin OprO/OprP
LAAFFSLGRLVKSFGLLAAAALASAVSTAAIAAPALPTEWKGADGSSFKITGLVMLDYVAQDVERIAPLADVDAQNSRLRLGRLSVEGTYTKQWAYRAEFSAKESQTQWDDLWLEYRPTETTGVKLGHFKTLSLENMTSERYMTFMERGAFADLTDTGRVLTLAGRANGERWSATAALLGDDINAADVGGSERVGAAARATFAPILTETTAAHLGGWVRGRDAKDGPALAYRMRPNTASGARYVDAGSIGESDRTWAVEGALVHRSLSVQAEWAELDVDLAAGGGAEAQTGYVFASWFVTGESRNYDAAKGQFGGTKVKHPTTDGGFGALELAARYEVADVSDVGVGALRGEQRSWTVGANWHPINNVRVMVNYTDAEADTVIAANRSDVRVAQARAMFFF